MKKIKSFLLSLVATLIVILGVCFFNFYLTHSFGIVSLAVGLCGFFLLFPAIKEWEDILSGKNANRD